MKSEGHRFSCSSVKLGSAAAYWIKLVPGIDAELYMSLTETLSRWPGAAQIIRDINIISLWIALKNKLPSLKELLANFQALLHCCYNSQANMQPIKTQELRQPTAVHFTTWLIAKFCATWQSNSSHTLMDNEFIWSPVSKIVRSMKKHKKIKKQHRSCVNLLCNSQVGKKEWVQQRCSQWCSLRFRPFQGK